MEHSNHHIVPYKVYARILGILVVLTGISVAVTQIELGVLTVTVALLLATAKSVLVLLYFMHLNFKSRLILAFLAGVLILMGILQLILMRQALSEKSIWLLWL
jgi:cytochrome c oxidase subunit IV